MKCSDESWQIKTKPDGCPVSTMKGGNVIEQIERQNHREWLHIEDIRKGDRDAIRISIKEAEQRHIHMDGSAEDGRCSRNTQRSG